MATGSRDVLPATSVNDVLDCRVRDAESLGEASVRPSLVTQSTNRPDVGLRQLRIRDFAMRVALLLQHVFRVLRGRSEKQMTRIAARRVVATVQNEQGAWIDAVRNLVCDAMRALALHVPPVTLLGYAGFPRPTLIMVALVDLRPKSCDLFFVHGKFLLWTTASGACKRRGAFHVVMQEGC